MRNGDVYKIQALHRTGVSAEEICQRFRNRYPREEVLKFLPGETKKPIRRKRAPARSEVTNDVGSVDM